MFERTVGPNPLSLDGFRRVWGLGIAGVMILAVSPYPVLGVVSSSEIPHRIHNTVGALQYLPLWAVPVLVFTFGRGRTDAWRLAVVSSVAIAGTGVWSGDLIASLSWMPLATLLVLWPGGSMWRPRRISMAMIAPAIAALVTVWVACTEAPHLVDLQRLRMGDSHSLRFHFSGMAAAYIALALSCLVVCLYPTGRSLVLVVSASVVVAGACSIAWSNYESALSPGKAWWLVFGGAVLAFDIVPKIAVIRRDQ